MFSNLKHKIFSSLLFVLFFLFLAFPVNAAEPKDYLEGKILVQFKRNTQLSRINETLQRFNLRLSDRISQLDTLVLNVPKGAEEAFARSLSRNPLVEYAEPDYIAQAFWVPNDPYFFKQWGFNNTGQEILGVVGLLDADIDAPEAWELTLGGVKVAILDTGIDQNHEDLSTQIVLNKDFTGSSTGYDDFYGHGTHVAGIVAAVTNNSIGAAGGCPHCQLINGKVLDDTGSGAYSWIANGIIWAADNGAKVINLSLGGSSKSRTLENAINYAWNKGAVVVAAAGNSGNPSKTYPAAYSRVIAVAATNNKDQKSSFSNYGSLWVDVAAPGENIFSTFPNHPFVIQTKYGRSQDYDFASGTSMAAPMTSGVVALVWSTPYGTSNSSVRARLELTADKIPGTGFYWSAGRINAGRAVSF